MDCRIVSDVTLDVPGLEEPAVGRLISLPRDDQPGLNRVHLRRGRKPESDRAGEVLVSDAFFEANSLALGDQIEAVLNGRLQTLTLVGVALSPEYVIQIRGGDLLPDEKRFGIFWMPRRQMEAAFNMEGAFNDVSLRLLKGANEQEVIDRLDAILKPYGSIGAIGRDHHISARFLADEIKQLRATGLVAPTVFLGVAAFLLNIVLSRRISAHRSIIATLKAFGYTNLEIGWHYMLSTLIVATAGALSGVVGGFWMGSGLATTLQRVLSLSVVRLSARFSCDSCGRRDQFDRSGPRFPPRGSLCGETTARRSDATGCASALSSLVDGAIGNRQMDADDGVEWSSADCNGGRSELPSPQSASHSQSP